MKSALVLLTFLLWAPLVQAEGWYCVVWSWNNARGPVRPLTSHTCAAWVRVSGERIIDKVEINWGPDGHRPIADSVEEARSRGLAVRRWVLATDAKFVEAARKQKASLVGYKMLDRYSRPMYCNCIHAVSDVTGPLDTGPLAGIAAGQKVVDFFIARGLTRPSTDYWLANVIESGK